MKKLLFAVLFYLQNVDVLTHSDIETSNIKHTSKISK